MNFLTICGGLCVFAAGILCAGCEPRTERAGDGDSGVGAIGGVGREVDFGHRFPLSIGGKQFFAQVALTQIETANGLMFREKLGADEGMLFVFREAEQRAFWMRNVPISISLGYITADGRLDEIRAMEAENPEPVPSRSHEIQFVLEMPAGWFAANGVRVGAKLDLRAVRAAVKARGFRAENFGF